MDHFIDDIYIIISSMLAAGVKFFHILLQICFLKQICNQKMPTQRYKLIVDHFFTPSNPNQT